MPLFALWIHIGIYQQSLKNPWLLCFRYYELAWLWLVLGWPLELKTVIVNIKIRKGWDPLLSQNLDHWMRTVLGGQWEKSPCVSSPKRLTYWLESRRIEKVQQDTRDVWGRKLKMRKMKECTALMASAGPVSSSRNLLSNVWQLSAHLDAPPLSLLLGYFLLLERQQSKPPGEYKNVATGVLYSSWQNKPLEHHSRPTPA